jgi:aminopeptidase N
LTVSPIPGSTGQGFPGLVYLPTASYLSPDQRPGAARDRVRLDLELDILAAHEVAHQWWGNVVAPAGVEDAWVAEALANYSALLYIEKQRGPRVLASVLTDYKAHLLANAAEGRTVESMGPIVWGLRLESSQAPDAWRIITYEKGSWIVHMLRRRLGDDRFLAMLAELAKRYRYSTITTEQFRALAAEFVPAGMPDSTLEAFFQSSVQGTGVPTLQIKYAAKGKAPSVRLCGTVSQSSVEDGFSTLAPVEIQPAAGKPIVRWVQVEGEPASFDITLKAPPLKVQLDPTDSVLAVRK